MKKVLIGVGLFAAAAMLFVAGTSTDTDPAMAAGRDTVAASPAAGVDLEVACQTWASTNANVVSMIGDGLGVVGDQMVAVDIAGALTALGTWKADIGTAESLWRSNPVPDGAPTQAVLIDASIADQIATAKETAAVSTEALTTLDTGTIAEATALMDEMAAISRHGTDLADAMPRCDQW